MEKVDLIKAREGDLIQSKDNIIFDVKGLVHPKNRVIAFLRYVPDPKGKRIRFGKRYSKYYSLSKRYDYLKKNYPKYLVKDPVFNTLLCEVPINDIKNHFNPTKGLQKLRKKNDLDEIEALSLEFMSTLKERSGVNWKNFGISGSILVNIYRENSDLDLIVYGSKTSNSIAKTMTELLEDKSNQFQQYDHNSIKELFDFRSKDTIISFEDFVRTDIRKISHGIFMEKHFFIRFVKDYNEITEQYGCIIYKPHGKARIKATIADDSEALFTPCTYVLENVEIIEGKKVESIQKIVSFRGRFCEHAKIGERIIAQGKLEKIKQEGKDDYYRLLLGNKPSDHMILV